jgi:cytoplasmic iron level regulating protein YaaA (DUF328/UPF0246 family)
MNILLSPAKTLDLNPPIPSSIKNLINYHPLLIKESLKLIKILKKKSAYELSIMMNVSDKISQLNYKRFQNWKFPYPIQQAIPCVYMFKGTVYQSLDITSFKKNELKNLNKKLFILSGLYGILKPFDCILPYRLEMKTKIKHNLGTNLTNFWSDKIARIIVSFLNLKKNNIIVNLTSYEYYKTVEKYLPKKLKIINPIFKDWVKGNYKTVPLKTILKK